MKLRLLTLVFLACSAFCHAQEECCIPHVSVYGTAEMDVPADEMHWSITVQSNNDVITTLATEHDASVDSLVTFLKSKGVLEENIKASNIQMNEDWSYDGNGTRIKNGYVASTTILFESPDLTQYEVFWLGISELKNVSVNSVLFDTSKRIEYQTQSRIEAIKAAKEKAEALAGALDSKVREPLQIQEEPLDSTPWPTPYANMSLKSADSGSSSESITPGTITISTRVQVTFRITTR